MSRDDDLRRVAEDVRALARSLARDVRQAVDDARRNGPTSGRAVGDSIREVAEETRRNIRSAWGNPAGRGRSGRPYGPGYGGHQYYGRPNPRSRRGKTWYPPYPPGPGRSGGLGGPAPGTPGTPLGGPGPEAGPATDPGAAGGWCGGGPPRARHHRRSDRGPRPPVRHRWDATTLVGVLAVLFGVAWLLGAVHAFDLPVEGIVAVGLMLLGASLVVTGRTDWSLSRRSWPVWFGLLLIVVLISTSSTFGVRSAVRNLSFGNKSVTVAETGQVVHGGFGNVNVDASRLTGGDRLEVDSVAGNVRVTVPAGAVVTVSSHVFAGEICVNGTTAAKGVGATAHRTINPGTSTGPPIDLTVREAFGQVSIDGADQGCDNG